MVDIGAEQTDRLLEDLEKRLEKEYAQAYKEVEKKAADYFAKFEKKDKQKQAEVKAGKLTEKEYKQWRQNQMLTGKRWTDLRDQLAYDLTRTNQMAAAIVRGELNEVFAINANYSEYLIENGMRTNYGFTLYDRNTVANLVKNDPDIIPWKPEVDIPADLRWNRQMITSHITQGILQGESIPNLSKRLMKTVNNDKVAAVRTARTAVTSSQNAGRQMVYDRAKAMGLKLQKEWLATLDGRTRHEHGAVDGQRVPLDGKFNVGGYKMEYPGDMSAPAHLVYNCRCTMITVEPPHITKGEEPRKTYDEWIAEKGGKEYEKYQGKKVQFQKAMAEKQEEEPKPQKPIEYQNPTSEDYSNLGKASRKNVSKEDQEQIFKHDGGGYVATHNYSTINSNLRKDGYAGNPLTDDDKKTISALDRAISKTQTDKDYVFTRYVNADYLTSQFGVYQTGFHGEQETISNMILEFRNTKKQVPRITQELQKLIGTDDIDPAFLSASMLPDKNIMKSKSVLIKIKAPKGTDVYVPKNRKESECIFGREVKRTIESVEFDEQQNKWIITEVISNG